jgi:hypothetical protein
MVADIEANLKLFLTNRWQNTKKFTLPTIFNFDERDEVNRDTNKKTIFFFRIYRIFLQ